MKIARFDRLLASTALALVLALSSQTGSAQQTEKAVQASVPVPDTSLPPPLTAKDFETPAKQAAPADVINDEPKQTVTAPSVEPPKAATAPAAISAAPSGLKPCPAKPVRPAPVTSAPAISIPKPKSQSISSPCAQRGQTCKNASSNTIRPSCRSDF